MISLVGIRKLFSLLRVEKQLMLMSDHAHSISPEVYIRTKCRQLPFFECLINERWTFEGMASLLISRRMPSGKIIVGFYLVDIYCLGVKDSGFKFAIEQYEYRDFISHFSANERIIIPCDLSLAHDIIYGAIDYADELGFKPHPSFALTEYILDPDLIDNRIDEIEFGHNGKPLYTKGPGDNSAKILATLRRVVGEGNFEYILDADDFYEDE